MNDLFSDCLTKTDVMRRTFELSGSTEYTKAEITSMANKRRAELEQISVNECIIFKKIMIPNEEQQENSIAQSSVIFESNPTTATTFTFIKDSKYIIE